MMGRYFLAWRMFETAKARDDRDYKRWIVERARANFNPLLDLTETQFRERYRLSKKAFKVLIKILKDLTSLRSSKRVSLEHKVYTALFYYATGAYQKQVGVPKYISQKMCTNYVDQVTQALNTEMVLQKYIMFPATPAARKTVSEGFFNKYGMPGVVGCIGASHFKVVVPDHEEAHWYYSRKHYHSLNVQMICDADNRIVNINSKFGGSSSDYFIWEKSLINPYLKSLHQNGEVVWLLGDSGYPQRPWLMTPISDATPGSPEAIYNDKHIKARVVIENTFSQLRNRWRCLHKDRTLQCEPLKSAKIIIACSVLHNIMIELGDPEDVIGLEEAVIDGEQTQHVQHLLRGRALRSQLVRRLTGMNESSFNVSPVPQARGWLRPAQRQYAAQCFPQSEK